MSWQKPGQLKTVRKNILYILSNAGGVYDMYGSMAMCHLRQGKYYQELGAMLCITITIVQKS
jgi:hypothetical protein